MESDPILGDKRFTKLATDPKFRSVGKKHKKVKIDKRFQSLFTNEKFSSKCSVDKRGRPKNLSARESFEKFYRLEDSESDSENSEKSETEEDAEQLQEEEEPEGDPADDEEEEEAEFNDSGLEQNIKSKLHSSEIDYARGEGTLYSDSSSEEEDEDGEAVGDGDDVQAEDHFDKWGELDGDAERTEEETARLAVCNMDWDRVGPEDLFLLLSSFCPSTGTVSAVNLYLSDFGRERLEEEKMMGPRELRRMKGEEEEEVGDSDSDSDLLVKDKKTQDKEQSDAMERVRQYQVNRLKYYYAIVDFDSVDTASKVYEECDGLEYELSATRLDLRFVPSDLTFSAPHSCCLHHPEPDKYQPKVFFTTALQQGKVELTWDEEDHDKLKSMKEAFSQVDDDEFGDVSNIIGSASESEEEAAGEDDDMEEEEEDEKDTISRYRALLTGIAEKDSQKPTEKGNMEFTWNEEVPEETEEEHLTPWEKYLQKKKEKRSSKKKQNKAERNEDMDSSDEDIPDDVDLNDPFFAEELGQDYVKKKGKKENKKKKTQIAEEQNKDQDDKGELGLMVMDSDDEKEHFDFKHILEAESKEGKKKKKKWRKKKKELDIPTQDSFSVNVGDSRFSAMYSRPEFNIDPTDPNFKKTKNMEKIIGEKQKRFERHNPKGESGSGFSCKKQKLDPDVSRAIKSVKSKWNKNAKKSRKLTFKVKDS